MPGLDAHKDTRVEDPSQKRDFAAKFAKVSYFTNEIKKEAMILKINRRIKEPLDETRVLAVQMEKMCN